jgi:hypothetical protein
MTNRDFYEAVINFENLTDEQKTECFEHAKAEIDKLDATNEKRKAATALKAQEKEAERAPIREAIVACLDTETAKTATTLIEEAGVATTPQSVPHLLKAMIDAGEIVKTKVKVAGKKTAQVGYLKA